MIQAAKHLCPEWMGSYHPNYEHIFEGHGVQAAVWKTLREVEEKSIGARLLERLSKRADLVFEGNDKHPNGVTLQIVGKDKIRAAQFAASERCPPLGSSLRIVLWIDADRMRLVHRFVSSNPDEQPYIEGYTDLEDVRVKQLRRGEERARRSSSVKVGSIRAAQAPDQARVKVWLEYWIQAWRGERRPTPDVALQIASLEFPGIKREDFRFLWDTITRRKWGKRGPPEKLPDGTS